MAKSKSTAISAMFAKSVKIHLLSDQFDINCHRQRRQAVLTTPIIHLQHAKIANWQSFKLDWNANREKFKNFSHAVAFKIWTVAAGRTKFPRSEKNHSSSDVPSQQFNSDGKCPGKNRPKCTLRAVFQPPKNPSHFDIIQPGKLKLLPKLLRPLLWIVSVSGDCRDKLKHMGKGGNSLFEKNFFGCTLVQLSELWPTFS